PDRSGDGRRPRAVDADALWLARDVRGGWLHRVALADSLVSADALEPSRVRVDDANEARRVRGSGDEARHQSQPARRVPRLLLLRLLLVLPRELAAGLPGDGARPDADESRRLRGLAILRLWLERADRRLDCRPDDCRRLERDERAQRDRDGGVSLRAISDSGRPRQ